MIPKGKNSYCLRWVRPTVWTTTIIHLGSWAQWNRWDPALPWWGTKEKFSPCLKQRALDASICPDEQQKVASWTQAIKMTEIPATLCFTSGLTLCRTVLDGLQELGWVAQGGASEGLLRQAWAASKSRYETSGKKQAGRLLGQWGAKAERKQIEQFHGRHATKGRDRRGSVVIRMGLTPEQGLGCSDSVTSGNGGRSEGWGFVVLD
jgi:hypothetical protein